MKLSKLCTALGLSVSMLFSVAAHAADPVKIGFIVKQPEDPWFQDEWKYARQAAKEKGFDLVTIGAQDGEKVLTAIDNLAAQHAQGFVICVPDIKLGSSVVAKAKKAGLKVISVDDRFVDASGRPMVDVPYVGISATNIGRQVGQALLVEMKKRGWNMNEVGALRISFDQLPTSKERTDGAVQALKDGHFPVANIYDSPQVKLDTESALNAANTTLSKHKYKHWIAFGSNDAAVLGAVRSVEGHGIAAKDMIGVGINGSNDAINEFNKPQPTGFYGSIKLSAKQHGYDTSSMMYAWIKQGKAPALLTYTSGTLMTKANYKTLQH